MEWKLLDTGRVLLLLLIMAAVGLIMSVVSIVILYETSFDQSEQRLVETVRSRARLIEAIARHDIEHRREHGTYSQQMVIETTMQQVRDAHHQFTGFGETGEFTMGRMEGDQIVFVLRHRHADQDKLLPIPFQSATAEPMRQALLGHSGVLIGLDYRNAMVLAAHEPIQILGMGVVAKIDMDEIRRPFIRAGVLVLGIGLGVILLGILLFYRVGRPMMQQLLETRALRQSRQALVKAQAALRENTLYLDNILRTSTDLAIVATDLEFVIKYFNPEAERLYGRPAEQMLGRTVEVIHQEIGVDQDRFMRGIQAIKERGDHPFQIKRPREDGLVHIIEARASGILDRQGALTGYVLMSRDVTETRLAQEKIARTERQYRLLMESANDAIFIADAQSGIILDANAMAGELLGRPVAEVVGMNQTDLHPPEELSRYQKLFMEHVQKGRGLLSDIVVVRKDGSHVPVEIRAGVTDLGDRKVIQGIFRDITERQAFERSLQDERRKFQATFEQAAVGIAHVAMDGDLILLNNRFCQIIGYTGREMVVKSLLNITHPDDLVKERAHTRALQDREISSFSMEKRYIHKQGHPVWVLLTVSLVVGENAEPPFFIKVIEDISDRKRLEERLQMLNLDLERQVVERTRKFERSNQDLQQFAYVASHDLQEPLRLITGYVQLLEKRYRGALDDQADKYITYVVDSVNHMQSLINNLLAYARMGSKGGAFEASDVNRLLDRALANLAQPISTTGAVVTRENLPIVKVDPVQFTQLLQNLLGNAIKFHGEHPPVIHVAAQRGEGEWIFGVQDNGIGIDARHRERIFLIFQKLHSRTRYEGTGIGLALCKRIVERHGGRIWVDSMPDQGSAFRFSIPDANLEA